MIETLLDHTLLINKKNDIVVFDLGANDGRFYEKVVEFFGHESIKKYIGVEPNTTLFKEKLLPLHGDNIIMVNKAIYNETDLELYFTEVDNHEAGNMLAETNERFKWGEKEPKKYKVNTVTISDLMNDVGVDYIDYLKIDIEGSEYALIDSLTPELCEKINQISVEFHDFIDPDLKDKTNEYVQKVIDLGYNLHFSAKWTGRFGTDYMDTLFIRK